jgi:hypothetical protein
MTDADDCVEARVGSRLYRRSPRFAPSLGGGARPLEACLAWVADHRVQYMRSALDRERVERHELAFTVLAHETTSGTKREFEAFDGRELARWARTPCAERHAHEVLVGPCKAYVDIELPWATNVDAIAADVADRFADALVAELGRRFPNVHTTLVVLDASRSGVKFSRHYIVDMASAVDGQPVRFASREHVKAFVASVVRAERVDEAVVSADGTSRSPLVDYAVYDRNSTLRTLGSTKPTELDRPLTLLRLGDDAASAAARATAATERRDVLVYSFFEASLVTWPHLAAGTEATHVLRIDGVADDVPFVVRSKRSRDGDDDDDDDAGDLLAAVRAAIVEYGAVVTAVRRIDDSSLLRATTSSHECAFKGAAHGSNCIYLLVDAARGRYTQRCFSPKCAGARGAWTTLERAAAVLLLPFASAEDVSTPPPLARSAPPRLESDRGGGDGDDDDNVDAASTYAHAFTAIWPPPRGAYRRRRGV